MDCERDQREAAEAAWERQMEEEDRRFAAGDSGEVDDDEDDSEDVDAPRYSARDLAEAYARGARDGRAWKPSDRQIERIAGAYLKGGAPAAVEAHRKSQQAIRDASDCICHEGFGMNLSCPIHGVSRDREDFHSDLGLAPSDDEPYFPD